MAKEYPLVTLALFTYNQEEYVREAVEGALAQDYPNLEIIISDDCSTDGTWGVINECLEGFAGSHAIKLNRNSKNLGTTSHVQKVVSKSSGELIVLAGGDDISLPYRVSTLVAEFIKLNRSVAAIFSNAEVIDSHGIGKGLYFNNPQVINNPDDFVETRRCWAGGFALAFSKNLLENYSSQIGGTFQEDGVIAFRAMLNSSLFYIEAPLVKYRRHERNSYRPQTIRGILRIAKSEIRLYQVRRRDLAIETGIPNEKKIKIIWALTLGMINDVLHHTNALMRISVARKLSSEV